jgi:hypothetical protein
MLFRAKVVRRDGSDIGVGRALLRWLCYFMPAYGLITWLGGLVGTWLMILLPLASIAVAAFSREKRGIHDLIAGTVVVDATAPVLLAREGPSSEDNQYNHQRLEESQAILNGRQTYFPLSVSILINFLYFG